MSEQTQPKVSVVIPCYNAADYISAAINSVLDQGHDNLQIIVANDGSTDDSESVVQGFGDKIDYVTRENGGISAARNTGLKQVEGDYVAFLDADDLWCEGSLKARLDHLQAHPDVAYVFGKIETFLSEELEEGGDAIPEMAAGRLAGSLLVRREDFFRVGLFDENLSVGETMDWLLRAQEAGLKEAEVDHVVMRRRVHNKNTVKQEEELKRQYLHALRASLQRRRQQGQ